MYSEKFFIWCEIKLKEIGKKELRELGGISKLWNEFMQEINK